MAIKYKVVKLGNPSKKEEPKKFYAMVAESGRVDLPEIAENISRYSTTVSKTDIIAVLTVLTEEIQNLLTKGHSVHLGELGYFHPTIQSKGVNSEEMVSPAIIEKAKARFVAGKSLESALKSVEFKAAPKEKKD